MQRDVFYVTGVYRVRGHRVCLNINCSLFANFLVEVASRHFTINGKLLCEILMRKWVYCLIDFRIKNKFEVGKKRGAIRMLWAAEAVALGDIVVKSELWILPAVIASSICNARNSRSSFLFYACGSVR